MKKGWKILLTGIAVASAGFAAYTLWVEPSPHTSDIPLEDTPEAIDSAHGTDTQ